MRRKRILILGVMLLIGLMLTGCVGYYGGSSYRNHSYEWWDHRYDFGENHNFGGSSEHGSHGHD